MLPCALCSQNCVRELRVVVCDEADNLLDMGFRWVGLRLSGAWGRLGTVYVHNIRDLPMP